MVKPEVEVAALAFVAASGLFFLLLGGAALLVPRCAGQFLLAFASSPARHYAEIAVRLLIGGAFVLSSPRMIFSGSFKSFGWILLGTSTAMLLVPWRWHDRFARRAVPQALRFLPLIGASSVVAGGFILWAAMRGITV